MPSFIPPSSGGFALVTPTLILLPSPCSVHFEEYRTLFRKLHVDAAFCAVAFGPHFEPIVWNDEEMKAFMLKGDVAKRWDVTGMGDFAVGALDNRLWFDSAEGETIGDFKIVQGDAFEEFKVNFMHSSEQLRWVGYTCVRDATTSGGTITDIYASQKSSESTLPPPEEMVEVRYGMDPEFQGKGIATQAAKVAMSWAIAKKGSKRFIAETQGVNDKSQGLLRKLGFNQTDEKLGFREDGDDVVEWVKVVA